MSCSWDELRPDPLSPAELIEAKKDVFGIRPDASTYTNNASCVSEGIMREFESPSSSLLSSGRRHEGVALFCGLGPAQKGRLFRAIEILQRKLAGGDGGSGGMVAEEDEEEKTTGGISRYEVCVRFGVTVEGSHTKRWCGDRRYIRDPRAVLELTVLLAELATDWDVHVCIDVCSPRVLLSFGSGERDDDEEEEDKVAKYERETLTLEQMQGLVETYMAVVHPDAFVPKPAVVVKR